ncbi:hypothetical protein NA57DRAFT_75084 [Rhizodiscina lignyota]|uniref:ABM domain-containing protein n=1 Tax=Rhizodiscina lignyota TaxID=1504668 RepID=A0A9P4M6R0_9PEZI|nr:hypothetical protein NA57DRAFT_75084 [Rhizodiscina lignyota]
MPVSEIGLLKLKPTASLDDPKLRAMLTQIKNRLQDFTSFPFYYLQQVEDPSFIYLLGQWESLAQHYKDLHSSTEWREMVPTMQKYFEFQWMAHFDFVLDDLRVEAPLVQVGRFLVKEGKRGEVERRFERSQRSIGQAVTDGKVVSGWKVDEGRKKEEFVLLSPWKEVPQKEVFGEYFKIDDLVDEVDIKHMRIVNSV